MTLCLLLRDGDVGVLLSDRRTIDDSASSTLLISDTMPKLHTQRHGRFRLAIVAAGDDSLMADSYRRFAKLSPANVDDSYARFQDVLWSIYEGYVAQEVKRKQHEAESKARLMSGKARKEFLEEMADRMVSEEIDEGAEDEERDEYVVQFLFVAQDSEGLHPAVVTRWKKVPLDGHRVTHAIGTGKDLALAYLSSAQGGWGTEHPGRDLLFAAMNAYQLSTVNATVGGTPDVVLFDNGMRELTRAESSLLMNLSGAYQADLVSRRASHTAIDALIAKDRKASLAPLLRIGETPAAIVSAGLPLRIWQQRSRNPAYRRFLY